MSPNAGWLLAVSVIVLLVSLCSRNELRKQHCWQAHLGYLGYMHITGNGSSSNGFATAHLLVPN